MGVEAGFWWGELLSDQRPVDAFSLVYDSAPLKEELAIMGRPHGCCEPPRTLLLRTGSRGFPMLHPTQRNPDHGRGPEWRAAESMSDSKPLEPGKIYHLDVAMHLTTWVFPKGHRIRLSVSNALWPMVLSTPLQHDYLSSTRRHQRFAANVPSFLSRRGGARLSAAAVRRTHGLEIVRVPVAG